MKFEYSHAFDVDTMLKAQMQIAQSIYSKSNDIYNLLLTLAVFIPIFIAGMFLGALVVVAIFGSGAKTYGQFFGIIIGVMIGKLAISSELFSKIETKLEKKAHIPTGEGCECQYVFDATGITLTESGRKTTIDWSAISSVEQTSNYIGLLCYGLFYYLPRETIGDAAAQNQFITQCKNWMDEAKY